MKTKFYTKDIIEICDNKHLTVDEIFELISKKYPLAGKSSIYRNVEELSLSGELKKVVGASKKTYFEKSKHPHIHLIDEETGKIIDIDIDKIPNFSLPNGFEINDFDIKFYGKFKKN
ncbi:transcriptional repressor [Candidatus Gracilibacteria bacterium]|nr:transcriptional repressor [Candidatus Gracilibacteria bacterium]